MLCAKFCIHWPCSSEEENEIWKINDNANNNDDDNDNNDDNDRQRTYIDKKSSLEPMAQVS